MPTGGSDVAIGAAIAGAAVSAYGDVQSSQAASGAAKYNSEVAANNAKIATQNAAYASAEGEQNAATQEQKTRAEVGGLQAQEASQGVDVNSGSAVDVRSSAAETGELNAINIRAQAARQAYGYQTEAASDTGQSQLDQTQAQNDTTAGGIGAGASLIGGIGQAGSDYAKYGGGLSGEDPDAPTE